VLDFVYQTSILIASILEKHIPVLDLFKNNAGPYDIVSSQNTFLDLRDTQLTHKWSEERVFFTPRAATNTIVQKSQRTSFQHQSLSSHRLVKTTPSPNGKKANNFTDVQNQNRNV